MDIFSVILAGISDGDEKWSGRSSTVYPLCGEPLIQYVLNAVTPVCRKNLVVCAQAVDKPLFDAMSVPAVLCEGPSIQAVLPYIKGKNGKALIVRGDMPCVASHTYQALCDALEGSCQATILQSPQGDQGNAGAICLEYDLLVSLLNESTCSNLEDIAQHLMKKGANLCSVWMANAVEGTVVKTRRDYAYAFAYMQNAIREMHMTKGVTILDPASTYIEADVEIGYDTIIYPGCYLQKGTRIGRNCTLLPNCRLNKAVVEDDVTIENSVLLECHVGKGTTVGPFAYLRPMSNIGQKCRIGDFVEIKNSTIGNETKVSHLTYVGDSDLGQNINLGCGVVFVNYDGKKKHRSIVEDDAFIGCNTNLVSPVHIGKEAYIAAGSTITEDVPDGALFVARAKGVIKEGWVEKRKESGKL